MLVSLLTDLKALCGCNHVRIGTIVWHGIVDRVIESRKRVQKLSATDGGADWVGLDVSLSLHEQGHRFFARELNIFNDPLVAESILCVRKMLGGVNHVFIEIRSPVILGVLRRIVPLRLRLGCSHLHVVLMSLFTDLNASLGCLHVWVRTKVWHGIIDRVTKRRFLVRKLVAPTGSTDGV